MVGGSPCRVALVLPIRLLSVVRVARLVAAIVLLASAAGPARAQMSCDPCAVGVVFDGPWERNDELRAGFEEEIAALAAPRFTVVFPAGARRLADWTLAGARAAVEALLADPDIDIVLTYGPVSSSHAINRGGLPKPVVAAFVLDPEAQGFPLETTTAGERVSGVPNPRVHHLHRGPDGRDPAPPGSRTVPPPHLSDQRSPAGGGAGARDEPPAPGAAGRSRGNDRPRRQLRRRRPRGTAAGHRGGLRNPV